MTAEARSSPPPVLTSANPPKTAFVFAGGGCFGSIQVGMLRALVSHGVTADIVVGSSVGAMNAAYFAGMPTAEGVETLAGIWRSLRRRNVFPITWRTMLGFIRRRDFLIAADGVRRLIDTHVPYRNLEDAKLPLHVVATDLLSGETVVLSKGPVAQAIVASTAIPAAFAPVQIENLYLADGAITCNTPVRVAVARVACLSCRPATLARWRRRHAERLPAPCTHLRCLSRANCCTSCTASKRTSNISSCRRSVRCLDHLMTSRRQTS
jgi:predicted acylesterase/phospholipase RssA